MRNQTFPKVNVIFHHFQKSRIFFIHIVDLDLHFSRTFEIGTDKTQ